MLKLAIIVLTIFIVTTTRAQKNFTACNKQCGEHTFQYPFGFSEGCKIRLTCSNSQVQLNKFLVQNITNSNILVNLPAKCNRSMQSIAPLFSENFAPSVNNSFLVQDCKKAFGGCVIPASNFLGNQFNAASCNNRSGNISCFTKQETRDKVDTMSYEDFNNTSCKYLFSAISFGQSKEIALQFQVVELGWWLQGQYCECSDNATCTHVNLHEGRVGFRCDCDDGFRGDGYSGGTGCRKGEFRL